MLFVQLVPEFAARRMFTLSAQADMTHWNAFQIEVEFRRAYLRMAQACDARAEMDTCSMLLNGARTAAATDPATEPMLRTFLAGMYASFAAMGCAMHMSSMRKAASAVA